MTIDIPPNEVRKFKSGILPNKLKYVVIQDETDDSSHVSVAINAGSLNEPIEYMGLAHFLEHMLFLGSKKYPKESYFEEILKTNGGVCNAYTAVNETVYFFNVLNDKLDETLSVFSRFFIDPLFNESSVEREINAINSEHLKNINNDFWFGRQVIYNVSKKSRPYHKHFTTGTLETLKSHNIKQLRETMIRFYKLYYCMNNMTLVVQSNNIERTESMIKKYFSEKIDTIAQIDKFDPQKESDESPNSCEFTIQKESPIRKEFPIRKESTNSCEFPIRKESTNSCEFQIIPANNINEIVYFWDVPTFTTFIGNNAINVISDVIDYNGIVNLKYWLKRKGLASSIDTIYLEEGIFILKITMCCESNKLSLEKINGIVKYYIEWLQSSKLSWDSIYQYMEKKYNINYLYCTKIHNSDLVNRIAVNLHHYNIEDVYRGGEVILKKNSKILIDLIKRIKFNNASIIYFTKNTIEQDIKFEIDKYYLRKYGQLTKSFIGKDKPSTVSERLSFEIKLEPKVLNIKPVVIKNLEQYNIPRLVNGVWYGASDIFNEPIVYGFIYLSHERLVNTAKDYMLTLISCSIINQYLGEMYSQQFELGYSVSMSISSSDGLVTINIIGLNSNYKEFFNQVISDIKNIKPEKIIIKICIDKILENITNINNKTPWEYADYLIGINKYVYSYANDIMYNTIKKIMSRDYIRMIERRIKRITSMYELGITSVVYGNIDKNIPRITSKYKPHDIPLPRLLKNISIKHPNKDEKNKLVMLVLNCGKFTPYNGALFLLLSLLLEQPAYQQLRTKHQLGYLVKSSLNYDNLNYYITIKVQSALDIIFVKKTMFDFIEWFNSYLKSKDINKIFNKTKESAVLLLLSKPTNINELMDKYIGEIRNRTYIFNRNELIAKEIDKIKLHDIKELYHQITKKITIIKIE